MGVTWSDEPDEHYKIMLDRCEHTMVLLCNEIEIDPQSERVQQLIDKHNEYCKQLKDDHVAILRQMLVDKLTTQVKNELGKPVMDKMRIEYLEQWVDAMTLIKK